jgi:hypothetical protein
MLQRKDLFEFMLQQIKTTADLNGDRMPQAFGRWFANMYFPGITNIAITDGSGDGKVDILVTCQAGKSVRYHILNTKFTDDYDRRSPVSFYDEITRFWQAFENKTNRPEYLANAVREPLRHHYRKLFKLYDEGDAKLYFVTNCRANENQHRTVSKYGVTICHLDDVLQYVAEHIEGAMPETEPLLLSGISNVLTPATNESEVPTSIVFARLIDFIKYMDNDPFDLLFARNVRLWLGNTETNKDIQSTFRNAPKEFAYSNNGITLLCRKHTHDPGKQELHLWNPRVVNGSQTLHSVRAVDNPSPQARVMVRIIEVPPSNNHDLPQQVEKRKAVIHKISIRSNLQNPIKRWNLVANDDFQNDLSRYFWGKKLYYERRQYEWKYRKLELNSVGISRGPDIRWATQLIASYYYDRKKLGPAVAQGKLNELFEEDTYAIIRSTPPHLVYQLYRLAEISERCLRRLSSAKQYISNVYGYIELAAFALICRSLSESSLRLGDEGFETVLEQSYADDRKEWLPAMKCLVDHILDDYARAKRKARRQEDVELTTANYFKSTKHIGLLLHRPIPRQVKHMAQIIKKST